MSPTLLVLALSQATATAPAAPAGPGPHEMTRSQIRAYNARLSRDDPAYIRCQRQEEIGSLVRTRTVCRTNAEWARVEGRAVDDARSMVERVNTSGSSNGN